MAATMWPLTVRPQIQAVLADILQAVLQPSICATALAWPWALRAHSLRGQWIKPVVPAKINFGALVRAAVEAAGARPRLAAQIIQPPLARRDNGRVIMPVYPPLPAVMAITIMALR